MKTLLKAFYLNIYKFTDVNRLSPLIFETVQTFNKFTLQFIRIQIFLRFTQLPESLEFNP